MEVGGCDFQPLGKEFDVLQPKLLRSSFVLAVLGVFSHSKEKVEGDECQFSHGLGAPVWGPPSGKEQVVGDVDRDCHLFFEDGVVVPVGFCLQR